MPKGAKMPKKHPEIHQKKEKERKIL